MLTEVLLDIYGKSVFSSGCLKTTNCKQHTFYYTGVNFLLCYTYYPERALSSSWQLTHICLNLIYPLWCLTLPPINLLVKKRGPKRQRQFLRPVFAQSMRCMWVPEIFTPVKQYNLPIDPVSICGSTCFSQSPQIIYFRQLWASVCEENWDHLYAGSMCIQLLKMVNVSESAWWWLTNGHYWNIAFLAGWHHFLIFRLVLPPAPMHKHSQLEVN